MFDELLNDLRFGLRTLFKNRGFALLAILTLGLGIGANTAIFSVINGVLLKPLPYEHGDRLVLVRQSAPLSAAPMPASSIKEYFDYREQAADVRRAGRIPPDELRPARIAASPIASTPASSRTNFFERARHQADPRPHLRAPTMTSPGAEAVLDRQPHLLAAEVRRRSEHRRPGVRDERSAAHASSACCPTCRTIRRRTTSTCRCSACPFRAAAERQHRRRTARVFSAR